MEDGFPSERSVYFFRCSLLPLVYRVSKMGICALQLSGFSWDGRIGIPETSLQHTTEGFMVWFDISQLIITYRSSQCCKKNCVM